MDIGVRLVTLELLDALLSEWSTFLGTLRHESVWLRTSGSIDIGLTSQDQQHISEFARATRDVAAASEATLKAIQLMSHFTPEQQRAFDRRAFEIRLGQQDVRNMMKDLEDNVKDMMASAERSVNQRQENSLKRLTVVASIFLPLTLACSLLSMTRRVRELDALWWDWLGICFIIGFAIITGYRLSMWWNELMWRIRRRWAQQPFHDMWQRARNRVIKQEGGNGNKVKRLLPAVTRWTVWTSKYLFYFGAIASFLVGMFTRIELGARSLGYSLAGAVALTIFIIPLWGFLLHIGRLSKHHLNRRPDKYIEQLRALSSVDVEEFTGSETTIEPERPRLIKLFRGLAIYFCSSVLWLLYIFKVFTCVWWLSVLSLKATLFTVKLFIGDLPGKVVEEFIVLVLTNIWPDLEWKGYKQSSREAWKRFAAASNDKRTWWRIQNIVTRQWER